MEGDEGEPGRIRAGGGREAGGDGARGRRQKSCDGGRREKNERLREFLTTFYTLFEQGIKNQNRRILTVFDFDRN